MYAMRFNKENDNLYKTQIRNEILQIWTLLTSLKKSILVKIHEAVKNVKILIFLKDVNIEHIEFYYSFSTFICIAKNDISPTKPFFNTSDSIENT